MNVFLILIGNSMKTFYSWCMSVFVCVCAHVHVYAHMNIVSYDSQKNPGPKPHVCHLLAL